jgi:hypothetical protein
MGRGESNKVLQIDDVMRFGTGAEDAQELSITIRRNRINTLLKERVDFSLLDDSIVSEAIKEGEPREEVLTLLEALVCYSDGSPDRTLHHSTDLLFMGYGIYSIKTPYLVVLAPRVEKAHIRLTPEAPSALCGADLSDPARAIQDLRFNFASLNRGEAAGEDICKRCERAFKKLPSDHPLHAAVEEASKHAFTSEEEKAIRARLALIVREKLIEFFDSGSDDYPYYREKITSAIYDELDKYRNEKLAKEFLARPSREIYESLFSFQGLGARPINIEADGIEIEMGKLKKAVEENYDIDNLPWPITDQLKKTLRKEIFGFSYPGKRLMIAASLAADYFPIAASDYFRDDAEAGSIRSQLKMMLRSKLAPGQSF